MNCNYPLAFSKIPNCCYLHVQIQRDREYCSYNNNNNDNNTNTNTNNNNNKLLEAVSTICRVFFITEKDIRESSLQLSVRKSVS